MKNQRKKFGWLRVILILFPLLAAVAVIAFAAPLWVSYHRSAYENREVADRSDSFVLPEYPEVIPGYEGITDYSEPEPPVIQTESVAEDVTENTTVSDTVETDANTDTEPDTTTPVVSETVPVDTVSPETLPNPVNPNGTVTAPEPYDPNASFGNSDHTVSVYGSVPIYAAVQKDPNVRNILVIGTDSRDVNATRGRSDTMIVLSVNAKEGTIRMVSFLRDSLVPIEGFGWNRLNTAYYFGGIGLAINTINDLFGLDIQEFVVLDFNGAKDFIDYVGGVDIVLTEAEAGLYQQYNQNLWPGMNHLNGAQALMHMQNRTSDSDFGRTSRQRDVITALVRRILREKNIFEIYDIADYAFGLVKTNLSLPTLLSIVTSVAAQGDSLSLESCSVPFPDSYQYGWYERMAVISFDIASATHRLQDFLYKEVP